MDNDHPVKKGDEGAPTREVKQLQEPVRLPPISTITQGLPCYFQTFMYPLSDAI